MLLGKNMIPGRNHASNRPMARILSLLCCSGRGSLASVAMIGESL